ncbi:hypothetical protein J3F83DRAFT_136721 [Trichoderma novae-zelandiae]
MPFIATRCFQPRLAKAHGPHDASVPSKQQAVVCLLLAAGTGRVESPPAEACFAASPSALPAVTKVPMHHGKKELVRLETTQVVGNVFAESPSFPSPSLLFSVGRLLSVLGHPDSCHHLRLVTNTTTKQAPFKRRRRVSPHVAKHWISRPLSIAETRDSMPSRLNPPPGPAQRSEMTQVCRNNAYWFMARTAPCSMRPTVLQPCWYW